MKKILFAALLATAALASCAKLDDLQPRGAKPKCHRDTTTVTPVDTLGQQ